MLEDSMNYLDKNLIQVILTLGLVLVFLIARRILGKLVKTHSDKYQILLTREVYIRKLIYSVLFLVFVITVGVVWEVSFQGLSVYFASIFAVVGVALFAHWSILSNLTASVILFFFFPYKIGNKIKIVDGDNSVEGEIIDISLFYIKVKSGENTIYSYPNNLAIQKPMMLSTNSKSK